MLVSYGAEAEEALAACDPAAAKERPGRLLQAGAHRAAAGGHLQSPGRVQNHPVCRGVRAGTAGIGQQLCFALQQSGWRGTFLLHAVDNRHLLHANVPQLRKDQALDAAALADSVLNILTSRSME